jgi:hypothetical protein
MTFYDFYTNNVGKKDFIETIEPTLTRTPSNEFLYEKCCIHIAIYVEC